jgi:hypothetical protein
VNLPVARAAVSSCWSLLATALNIRQDAAPCLVEFGRFGGSESNLKNGPHSGTSTWPGLSPVLPAESARGDTGRRAKAGPHTVG